MNKSTRKGAQLVPLERPIKNTTTKENKYVVQNKIQQFVQFVLFVRIKMYSLVRNVDNRTSTYFGIKYICLHHGMTSGCRK